MNTPLPYSDYLIRILTASVYDVAVETPLEPARSLSVRLKNNILLKREDLQPVFSFKIRGAYNKMSKLPKDALACGVIAASAGNHAQGVALSAQRLGCRAVIVMPETTPKIKVDAVKSRGGEVVLRGVSYNDAYDYAMELAEQEGLTYIAPFDDPDVIAGQGTVGMEIVSQHPDPIRAVFVPIGGGGLAAGMAAFIKQVRPEIKVIGVQTNDSCCMKQSVEAGEIVHLKDVGLFSDGTAVKVVGNGTFRLCKELLDEIITVDTDAVCGAVKDIFDDTRSITEPACALALAGLKAYIAREGAENQTLIAVTSGANMNFTVCATFRNGANWARATKVFLPLPSPKNAAASLSLSIYWEIGILPSSTTATAAMKKRISLSDFKRQARRIWRLSAAGWMRRDCPMSI